MDIVGIIVEWQLMFLNVVIIKIFGCIVNISYCGVADSKKYTEDIYYILQY